MDLEALVNDQGIVPVHLRREGVDIALIEQSIGTKDQNTFQGLYDGMGHETKSVLYETLGYYARIFRDERVMRLRFERLKLQRELEEAKRRVKEAEPEGIIKTINDTYTNYLLDQELPKEKINLWRKFLLGIDANIAQIFGRKIEPVEPDGFGLYALVGYSIRKQIRYRMLQGTRTG